MQGVKPIKLQLPLKGQQPQTQPHKKLQLKLNVPSHAPTGIAGVPLSP